MKIKVLISFLLFQLSLAQTFSQKPLQCTSPRSKICLLQIVTLMGSEEPKFPDLADKHTLIIRAGNIPHLTKNYVSQFGGVTKVTLGRLNIESLYIPSNWVSLNVESNQIRELIVEETDDNLLDGVLHDEPVNPIEDAEPESGTGSSVTEDAKEGPKTENAVNSKEGAEKAPKTENPKSSTEDAKEGPKTENAVNSKEGAEEAPKTENPKSPTEDAKEGPKSVNPGNSKEDAEEAPKTEKPDNSQEDPTEIPDKPNTINSKEPPKSENPDNSKQASIDVPKPENPATFKEDPKATTTTPEPLVGYRLQSLNLANNKLQTIRELKCMINLKELRLDGNELEFIEMATFDGMTKLRKLSLARNKINHISSPLAVELPSLEWFSLAFNRLANLQVMNWNMQQLVELDVSHNMLVKLDVDNFDQFVSLEKLAVANNSWTCYWINEALKEISKRDFITLVDQNDDPGNCPNGLPVEGICCSLTVYDDDESNNENLHDRIQRFQKEQDRMGNDLKGKIGSFGREWNDQWDTVNRHVTESRKRIEAREKEPKDDSKVTEKDLKELYELIDDCNSLLSDMESLRKENSVIARRFTQSFYTAIDLKNKLLAAMRTSTKLKNDLHQYEISFKADVK